ncbi:hypothetical protein PanWU01x14_209310, partial [Parasponia andersonii]
PPGGVMVANFETSKGYYANGTHEINKGRNILLNKSIIAAHQPTAIGTVKRQLQ